MSNPYDNLDFVSTKDLITLVTESVKSKFWDNLHPISRLHVIRTEGIFTPGTKGYGIGNRSFYGKLDENVTLLYQLSDCEKLAPYPKSRSKRSRYSSENDVLIEKSVKYTDFFLLSIVYV